MSTKKRNVEILGLRTMFTQGGVNFFKILDDPDKLEAKFSSTRDGWYGWFGYGGSVFQWHPELKIGFGYTNTRLRWFDWCNNIGAKLQQCVVQCLMEAKPSTG